MNVQILVELRKIKELLNSPEKWCKKQLALDANKNPCFVNGESAVSWCLVGASLRSKYGYLALGELEVSLDNKYTDVVAFNNHRDTTYNDVIALIDKSINRKLGDGLGR